MTMTQEKTSKNFEAEVSQILDLVINSLYSNKEIFLRELISNSSDALDKLRFQSLTNSALLEDSEELQIKIWTDSENKRLFIQDNGIGLNQEDMERNLGTIAKSGTKEFMKNLSESKDSNFDASLIGQFGVGFYSAFIVADKVQVISRKAGESNFFKWESEAKANYDIFALSAADLESHGIEEFKQGTSIILDLKDDNEEAGHRNDAEYGIYLEEYKIRSVIKKYSDFIEYPIKLKVKNSEFGQEDSETKDVEFLWENVNSQKAIWTKSKNEISQEEYDEFYKHVSNDFQAPWANIHYSAEGTNEFKALLYIPLKAPFDLFVPDSQKGLQLYINKVFITNDLDLLLPKYLRFVKGVVDSSDLPLNVSRELLQNNPKVNAIKKNITKKVISKLAELLKKKREEYIGFFKEFGAAIKEGTHVDPENKEKIFDLLVYQSTKTKAGEYTTLAEYQERACTQDKKEIYFITGNSREELESSPYIEALKKKDIEVLFCTEAVDEWVAMPGNSYKEWEFKSATKGEIDLGEEEKEKAEKQEKEYADLLTALKDKLSENIAEIKFSNRLVDTLCCLVVEEHGMSANMERIFEQAQQNFQKSKRTLELNPDHAVVKKLNEIFAADNNDARLQEYAELIYGQALLLEGSKINDLPKFTKLITKLMV